MLLGGKQCLKCRLSQNTQRPTQPRTFWKDGNAHLNWGGGYKDVYILSNCMLRINCFKRKQVQVHTQGLAATHWVYHLISICKSPFLSVNMVCELVR